MLRSILPLLISVGLFGQTPLADQYRGAADKLIQTAKDESGRHAYGTLEILSDDIGNRISGSPQLAKAEAWAVAQMKAAGLQNVHTESAVVPHWVRGVESCDLLTQHAMALDMIGLGGSVGTPAGGIEADVVAVGSFDEFAKLPDSAIKGKIVLFDEPYEGYGKTVAYRGTGPSVAAKRGAIACLIRTVGSASLGNPHTGVTHYEDGAAQIPAAALSVEHASMLHRLCAKGGTVRLRLKMDARMLGTTTGENVIGEIPGSEKPGEVVILSGHLDSWDVGQGAQDDGIGAVLSLEAARTMLKAGLHPKRTVRVILWTCEEWGGIGAAAYAKAHKADSPNIVAAFESDSGNGRIQGFSLDLHGENPSRAKTHPEDAAQDAQALALMNSIAPLLMPLGADKMSAGGSGEDVGFLVADGAVGIGVGHDASRYFDVHHSKADTFDHINYEGLVHNVQAYSVMAFVLADMPGKLK
ncbi:MAG TPA: M20/M25/M40 family metallo-hydrolase [Holophagaceae bacterium]|jgi:carboxypeptidase Q|nr:M20/M25/M40 family metallo-hydrolase [Holophagaceae bacterium]